MEAMGCRKATGRRRQRGGWSAGRRVVGPKGRGGIGDGRVGGSVGRRTPKGRGGREAIVVGRQRGGVVCGSMEGLREHVIKAVLKLV